MARTKTQSSLSAVADAGRRSFFNFIAKRSGPFDAITLDRRRVYILPTKSGLMFAVLVLVLLVGSINYSKSLGFMLTFMLAAIGNVAMYVTWRNLVGLHLRSGGSKPVYARQAARFSVQLENTDASCRYSIAISANGQEYEVVDVPAKALSHAHFEVASRSRGVLNAGRFRLETTFPTGLFVAWTSIELNMSTLIYPAPVDKAELQVAGTGEGGDTDLAGVGLEEFSGLRKYQIGDSWRRVSWKRSAHTDTIYTKEFVGGKPERVWIDWNQVAANDTEQRLSILARLVLNADAAAVIYGLRLPNQELQPDTGSAHLHQCLRALALYGH